MFHRWFSHDAGGKRYTKGGVSAAPSAVPGSQCLPSPVISLHGPIGTVDFAHMFILNWVKEERLKRDCQDTEEKESLELQDRARSGGDVGSVKPTE